MLRFLDSIGANRSKNGLGLWKAPKNVLLQPEELLDSVSKCATLREYYQYPTSGLTPGALDIIRKDLTVQPKRQQLYSPGPAESFPVYKEGDGWIQVPRFYGRARWGCAEKVQLSNAAPMSPDVHFVGMLRPVQQAATKDVLWCLRKFGGAVLVKDCGMGKTVDGSYLAVELGLCAGVIVHNEDLAEQWKDRLGKWFPAARVSVIQRGNMDYKDMDFLIFMVQSITSRTSEEARKKGVAYPQALFDRVGFLIVDEAHHIGAPTFCKAVAYFRPQYTLAMTAPPVRKDQQAHLISWFMGPLAHFKEHDHTKHVTVHVHKCTRKRREIRTRTGIVLKSRMVNLLFDDPVRNQSILDRLVARVKQGRKIMVLSTYHYGLNTLHALLMDRLPDVDARFYTGKVPKAKRPEALKGQVIFATTPKGDEALDVPELDTLFRVDPVSESKQPVGRILRDHPEKQDPVVEHWYDAFSIFDGMFWNCHRYYLSRKYTVEWHTVDNEPAKGEESFTFF